MNRGFFPVAVLAMAGVVAMGCGGAPDNDATRLPGASPSQSQVPTGAPLSVNAPAERVYFGVTNHLHVGGDVLAELSLNAGAVVEMEVATADSSPLRFEIWDAHQGGWVELVNAFDQESGFVLTTFTAASDNVFLIHFPAPSSPRDVNLHMDCNRTSGRCTPDLQPGERCFQTAACSAGLACAPNDGACDPIWYGGTCVVPGDGTACEGLPPAPVCGCDLVTYANECLAVASGKGMKTSGACSATPPPG
jgi:hypothetical protein